MNEVPTVLVIGTGSIGERHLRCLQSTGRCRLAFCEPVPERRAEVAGRYSIDATRTFPTLEEAMDSGLTIDAAVVAAPAPFHIPMGRALAMRNIHILMEKPLSLSLEGVAEFREEIERRNLTVAVGYTHRAHPAVRKLKEWIDSGEFGRPLELRVNAGQDFAFLRPAYADVYFADPAMGGGAIQDMITHFYSVGDWLIGPITGIMTHARHQALPRVEVEDTVHSLADHNGIMASYCQNLTQPQNEVEITVICENGSVRADYANRRASWIRGPNGSWNHEPCPLENIDELYVFQNSAFLDAMEGRGNVLCSLEEATRTLRVNLASIRSAETLSWQPLG